MQRIRSAESVVSGMSLSSSSETTGSGSIDYDSVMEAASTKKRANALNVLHDNAKPKSSSSNSTQSKKSKREIASDLRRRRAKQFLSKLLRPCTEIPMSDFQDELHSLDGDDYTDIYEKDEDADEVDGGSIESNKPKGSSKAIGRINHEDLGYSDEDADEDDDSNQSYSTWGSSRSGVSNKVSNYDEAVLYYSDKIVDFVFDAVTTVQSTVEEGMERAQDRAEERKLHRQHLRRVRDRKAHLKRIRRERISRIRRHRLKELREESQRQEAFALRKSKLARLSSVDELSSRDGDDEVHDDPNRYVIPEVATDLTDVHSNCKGCETENPNHNQRHKQNRQPPQPEGGHRRFQDLPTVNPDGTRYRRYLT